MARIPKLFAVGLLAAIAAVASHGTASAQARFCPTNESFFGNVQSVRGNVIMVRTDAGSTGTILLNPSTRINTHGFGLRPGMFVGAYGCVTPDGVFHPTQITLAADRARYSERISGVVERITPGVLFVRESSRGETGQWYVPNSNDFRIGQRITGVGMIGANGAFYPQSIDNLGLAYMPRPYQRNTSSITLSGVVRRVMPGSLLVWEPSHGTTGTWIVRNARSFRVGQNVVATGTEDRRGNFYPYSVHLRY